MKKMIAFLMTLLFTLGLYAQIDSNARPASFAIVELFSRNPDEDWDHCVAKYDNGFKVGMDKIFKVRGNSGLRLDINEMDSAEFKVLDYFYKNGFELLNISRYNTGYSVRYYFKRKGI